MAWALTQTCWPQVLAPLFLLCILTGIFVKAWRVRALFLPASGIAAWRAADALQRVFARPRRSDWLIRHEHAFSFPSSHAAISTAFYLTAAILIARSRLPSTARYALSTLLVLLWAGILWSRLSLAAHYPTDIAGGVLLGAAVALALGAAVRGVAGRAAVH